MLDLFAEINYLAVLAAGAAGFLIAALWYSKLLFARAWMEENNFSEKDLGDPKSAMLTGFIANVILAFGLASIFLVMKVFGAEMSVMEGIKWGFFLAILIHGAAGLPNYEFENRSLTLFLIHIGNSALGMAAMGAILAVWN